MSELAIAKQLVLQFFNPEVIEHAVNSISVTKDGEICVEMSHPLTTQLKEVNGIPVIYVLSNS